MDKLHTAHQPHQTHALTMPCPCHHKWQSGQVSAVYFLPKSFEPSPESSLQLFLALGPLPQTKEISPNASRASTHVKPIT